MTLESCHDADGVVVVIDVLRAFTTAAFAFDRGAEQILLVSTVDEAFALREQMPDCLLIGEVGGLPIEGFDLPNSPTVIENLDLTARRLILRTTSGTQGVVRASRSSRILTSSLVVATATADYLRALEPAALTFVETGVPAAGGEEDTACADLIEGLVLGDLPPLAEIRERVRGARWAQRFADPDNTDFMESDLTHALAVDRFAFAMIARREAGLTILEPMQAPS